jgi:hypothetical protein
MYKKQHPAQRPESLHILTRGAKAYSLNLIVLPPTPALTRARHHSASSSLILLTKTLAEHCCATLPNTLAFLCFQRSQHVNITLASKAFLFEARTRFLACSHHSSSLSSVLGVTSGRLAWHIDQNQTSLAKQHWSKIWSTESTSCRHK